ncbi:MAG: O-antigen ligase family protein [Oscillospiraceae bacterium]|nr:O-antigen ligase family protein [Oscillospiraceae bacterium]
MKAIPFIIIALWQGGFSAITWLFAGIFAAVMLWFSFKRDRDACIGLTPYLAFGGLTFTYVISAIINGGHLAAWLGAVKVAVAFLWLLLVFKSNPALDSIALCTGLIAAITGIAAYSGLLPVSGMVEGRRLFGLFQYANVTAIFLAVCAFLTRTSDCGRKRRHIWAALMEIALILTQSVGGIVVYIIGWIVYLVTNKAKRPIITALIATALTVLSAAGMFLLRGVQPLATFAERIMHITDGLRTMLANPLGIGAGSWNFHVREYQTFDYVSVMPHSGYIQIGLAGGFSALVLTLALIGYWLWTCGKQSKKPSKYTISALMILVHAVQDISLSFLSVIILLFMCINSAIRDGKGDNQSKTIKIPERFRHFGTGILATVIIICVLAVIPESTKNQAKWLEKAGEYDAALTKLEKGFLLQNDDEALLLRMDYAEQTGNFAALDKAFELMKTPNARAYRSRSLSFAYSDEYEKAAEYTLLRIQKAPYRKEGYERLEVITRPFPAESRAEFLQKAEIIRENARHNAHFLTDFLNGYYAE